MKRVIVTGATGFVGRNLIKKLLSLDYYVYAITRPNSLNKSKLNDAENMKVIELDLNEIDKLLDYINTDCDIFCHLAWDGTRGGDRDNRVLQHSNYLNSLKTVEVAKKLNCKRYLTSGSQAEYGICNTKINEDTECKPLTEYGKRKYQFFNKASLLLDSYGISFKEARIFSLYGAGDNEATMICSVLNKMINNISIDLSPCSHSWNYLYIDDAIGGIVKLIESDCPNGSYNFGGDETMKLRNFVEIMQKVTKSKSSINYGAIPYPKLSVIAIDPDNSKLKKETSWSPKIDFEHGIKNMVDDLKK